MPLSDALDSLRRVDVEAMLLPPRPNGFAEGLPLFSEVGKAPADAPEPPEQRPTP